MNFQKVTTNLKSFENDLSLSKEYMELIQEISFSQKMMVNIKVLRGGLKTVDPEELKIRRENIANKSNFGQLSLKNENIFYKRINEIALIEDNIKMEMRKKIFEFFKIKYYSTSRGSVVIRKSLVLTNVHDRKQDLDNVKLLSKILSQNKNSIISNQKQIISERKYQSYVSSFSPKYSMVLRESHYFNSPKISKSKNIMMTKSPKVSSLIQNKSQKIIFPSIHLTSTIKDNIKKDTILIPRMTTQEESYQGKDNFIVTTSDKLIPSERETFLKDIAILYKYNKNIFNKEEVQTLDKYIKETENLINSFKLGKRNTNNTYLTSNSTVEKTESEQIPSLSNLFF
jgi:hypothetical protein